MKFGIALGRLHHSLHTEMAILADTLGFESVWLPEHLVLPVEMARWRSEIRRPAPVPAVNEEPLPMPEIVRLFHGSQIVADVLEAGRFYHDFFASWVYEAQHLDAEDSRNSANLLGGDFSIELLAPVDASGDTGAARFLRRHGPHFNNLAFWARDCRGLAQQLLDRGVRVAVRGHGFASTLPESSDFDYVITHPKDTHGLVLEFLEDQVIHDPRHRLWWDASFWRERHPLGIERLSHATVVVADLDAATRCFADVLGCTRVDDSVTAGLDAATGSAGAWLAIGDTIIELAKPSDDTSPRARHLVEHGSMLYSFTFSVRDLDAVVAHAGTCGVRVVRHGDHVVELDPATTFGSVYAFTNLPGLPAITSAPNR